MILFLICVLSIIIVIVSLLVIKYNHIFSKKTGVKFACISDFGYGNKGQFLVGKLLSKLIKNNKIDFVCGLGDNFYENGLSKKNWKHDFNKKFKLPYKDCSKKFYMVLGNHDYRGDIKLQYKCHFIDSRWIMPYKYYDLFKTKNETTAHFVFFDSNYLYHNDLQWNKQKKWLFNKLKENNHKVDWTILCCHHPWKSTGYHGNSDSILNDLYQELIKNFSIDFIISGHDHDKQLIMDKNKPVQIVIGTGSNPRDYLKRNKKQRSLKFYSVELGLVILDLYKSYSTISFLNEKGGIEYKKKILKPKKVIDN